MKKTVFYWWSMVLLLACSALVIGCDDDDDSPKVIPPENALTVVQKNWTFSGVADQYAVAVFANVKWKVSSEADWVTLDKTGGDGNGVFTVSVPLNNTGSSRTATLTVKAVEDEKLVATFGITQEAGVLNITSEENVAVPASGKTVVIDVESDMNYTFEMGDWVNVVAAPVAEMSGYCAVTHSKITLNIAPNHSTEARACDVVIKVKEDQIKKTIHIEQAGVPEAAENLTIDLENCQNDVLEILSTGGFLKIHTQGNIGYECELSAWMEWDGVLAAVDTELENSMSIRIMPNLEVDRQATLTFKWMKDEAEQTRKIAIYQKAITFSFNVETPMPYRGGEGMITLRANQGEGTAESIIKVELSGEGLDFQSASGAAFGSYTVDRAIPNYLTSDLNLQVIGRFQYRNNEPVVKLFAVKQLACPAIQVEGETNFNLVTAAAGSRDFTVQLPFEGAKWGAEIYTMRPNSSGQGMEQVPCTWVTLTRKENGFTVSWPENKEPKVQSATVKVYLLGAEESNFAIVNFEQEKAVLPELNSSDIQAKASDTGYDMIATYEPKDYYCTLEVVDNGGFLTLPDETSWKRESGMLNVSLIFDANVSADVRTAILKLSLYDQKGGSLVKEKIVNFRQDGKAGVQAITVTPESGELSMSGGRPLRVEVTGTDAVDWVSALNGSTPMWLDVQLSGGAYFLWFNGRGPSGSTQTLYAIPAGSSFDEALIDSYGKLVVTLP